jgi:hypothetical protein
MMNAGAGNARWVRRMGRERGAVLGIVLVLMMVLLLAAGLTVWGLRSETAAAGSDTIARQLLDCAEEGLAFGKQYFSGTAGVGLASPPDPSTWSSYFAANNLCAGASAFTTTNSAPPLPCPPFGRADGTGTAFSGTPPTGYPGSAPFTASLVIGSRTFEYTIAIYDNADDIVNGSAQEDYSTDVDNQAIVYSRCFDPISKQTRAVQGLVRASPPTATDYIGQAGHGFRNQGNVN